MGRRKKDHFFPNQGQQKFRTSKSVKDFHKKIPCQCIYIINDYIHIIPLWILDNWSYGSYYEQRQ